MYIASVSDSLKIWDASTSEREYLLKTTFRSNSEYLCLAWNNTNQVVAVGGRENEIHIVQASNGKCLQSFRVTESNISNFKVPALSFSHNTRYLTVAVEKTIQLWDIKRKQVKQVLTGHKGSIVSLHFNSNGDFFGADEEGAIKLWSSKSYDAVNITEDNRGVRPIYSLTKLAISSIAPIVAAGYDDGNLRVWDIANGINAIFELPIHMSKITDVSCSTKNARLIATASLDEHIHLIDTGAPARYVCSSINVEQRVSAISFHEDGMHCAVGATDGTILLYDWRNASEPVSVTGAHEPFPIHALSFQSYHPSSLTKEANSEYTAQSVRSNVEKATSAAAIAPKVVAPATAATRTLEEDLAVFESKPPPPRESTISTAKMSSPMIQNKVSFPSSSLNDMQNIPKHIASPSLSRYNSELRPKEEDAPAAPSSSSRAVPSRMGSRFPSHQAESIESSFDESRAERFKSNDTFSTTANAAIEEKTTTFADEYKRRIGSYLEVGQDRRHARDREFEEDVRHSVEQGSLPLPLPQSSSRVSDMVSSAHDVEEFAALREAVKPVTHKELEEALDLLKYDIHQELQEVMREQVRQFSIAKDETTQLIQELGKQLKDLIRANEELREENAYLRKIY